MDKLAIIQFIEGDNFPLDGMIMFKVTWGGQVADLEPVCSSARVKFSQETAFKLSPDDTRLVEEVVKLECVYTSSAGEQQNLGTLSLFLDPSIVCMKKWYCFDQPDNWPSEAPNVLISTFFESGEEPSGSCASATTEATASPTRESSTLKPVFVDQGYFLIGGSSTASEDLSYYSLSVTVSFAENLLHLFPSNSSWPPSYASFQFRFNLLGNPVEFESFQNLRNSVNISERASATIRSSSKDLLQFLKHSVPTLNVLLWCNGVPVAEASVPVKERIKSDQLENRILNLLHLEPVNIAGIYHLKPPLRFCNGFQVHPTEKRPQIGIVVSIAQISPDLMRPQPLMRTPYCTQSPRNAATPLSVPSPKPGDGKEKNVNKLVDATVLELEAWKEEQKLIEKEKQERSSAAYLELLNSEYRRQVALKEVAFERRVRRIEDLERQLEGIIDLRKQWEEDLRKEKIHLGRQKAQLERERAQVNTEVERITQNLSKKHKFELDRERQRHNDIVASLRRRIMLLEEECTKRTKDNQPGT